MDDGGSARRDQNRPNQDGPRDHDGHRLPRRWGHLPRRSNRPGADDGRFYLGHGSNRHPRRDWILFAALLGTVATLAILSGFRLIEMRLPSEFYAHHTVRFARDAARLRKKCASLLA